MLTVKPTKNIPSLMETLKHPGIWKAISGGSDQVGDAETILSDSKNHCFIVMDEGRNLGFTAYVYIWDGVYAIHNCLLTIGSRSVAAINDSLNQMKLMGAQLIISAYPADNRAARLMAEKVGFKNDTTGLVKEILPIQSPLPYLYQYKTLND